MRLDIYSSAISILAPRLDIVAMYNIAIIVFHKDVSKAGCRHHLAVSAISTLLGPIPAAAHGTTYRTKCHPRDGMSAFYYLLHAAQPFLSTGELVG